MSKYVFRNLNEKDNFFSSFNLKRTIVLCIYYCNNVFIARAIKQHLRNATNDDALLPVVAMRSVSPALRFCFKIVFFFSRKIPRMGAAGGRINNSKM